MVLRIKVELKEPPNHRIRSYLMGGNADNFNELDSMFIYKNHHLVVINEKLKITKLKIKS